MSDDTPPPVIDLAREDDFRLGEILVRPSTRQVEAKGASQTLQPRIMQVLVALARRQGQVISRDELTQTCWEGRAVGEDAINRCIQQIRKLGETSKAFEVETIPRIGYRLKAAEGAHLGSPAPDTPAANNAPSSRFPASRRWLIAAITAGLLFVGGLAAWWINLNSRTVTVSPVTMLAVLPFDAVGDDPGIQRMAAAIPLDIADQLSQAGISVKATAQSMTYAGEAKARAAQELGVDLLLDGTVKQEGDKVRISARVYHPKRGVILWSDDLVADPDDPFVDDRLSALMARSISWPTPLRLLNSNRPNAVEETRAFLRILQFNYAGDGISSREAARKFARDAPDLVAARTSTAIESMNAIPRLRPEERPEVLAFARKEAEVALRLDPRDGGAYNATATVIAPDKWADGIAMLRKGMEADPQYTRLENNLAERLLATGATAEALAAAKRARAGEPLSATRGSLVARALLAKDEIAEMNLVLDRHEQLWPNDPNGKLLRFQALVWTGALDDADALIPGMFAPGFSGPPRQVLEGIVKAKRSGKSADADDALKPCVSFVSGENIATATAVGCMMAGGMLNRPDAALAGAAKLLPRIHNDPAGEEIWLTRLPCCAMLDAQKLFMPWMAPVRADPRIMDVFERIGLLDYWRTTGNWPDFCKTEPQSVCPAMQKP